jgi:hypothetical protein
MLCVQQVLVIGVPHISQGQSRIVSRYDIESASLCSPPVIDRMDAIPREGAYKGV